MAQRGRQTRRPEPEIEMTRVCCRWLAAWLIASGCCGIARGAERVVINEVMYHPPADRDELQWVELFNTGAQAVNLSGWSFAKGLQFTFGSAAQIPAGGYLVVARDLGAFKIRYGPDLPVVGDFTGHLSHNGEQIALVDRG